MADRNNLSNLTPTEPASPTSNLAPRTRRGSTTSHAPSVTSSQAGRDREQLAQTLDLIHTSASRTDALTTFNDFAEPPHKNPPVVESKGLASDLVQQGLSGLYSRFREAVGGGAASKPAQDAESAEGLDSASRPSSNTAGTGPRTSISSPTRAVPPAGSTFNTAGSADASSSSRSQPHASQVAPSSSTKAIPSARPGVPGAAHALATVALDTVGATAFPPEASRSAVPSEDGLSRASGNRRSLSRADPVSPLAGPDFPNILDTTDSPKSPVDRVATAPRTKRDSIPSAENVGEMPLSPVKSTTASSVQSGDPRASSTAGSAIAKTPAVIERIARPRSPTYSGSHASSAGRGVPEGSPLNTSSHNSLRHDTNSRGDRSPQTRTAELRVPGTVLSEAASEQVNVRLEKMKKQVLSKEFWMADETCKECFSCGAVFNVVRRKHHCRTCGCIFDSKCTSIISGQKFGVSGNIRVCKTCLAVINRRYDTSGSDDSADDSSYLPAIFRPNAVASPGRAPSRSPARTDSKRQSAEEVASLNASDRGGENFDARSAQTPMMAIPATKRLGESHRRSAVLEIGAPQLSRPGSSRSLKSLASGRPQSSGHKRHHSKHSVLGKYRTTSDDRAPFRTSLNEEMMRKPKFPAFHDDNIIDPELADYMSDESSADEQMGLFATMSSADLHSTSFDNDKTTFGPLLTAGRRHRARDKSISGISFTSRGMDDGAGGHLGHRSSRRRNLSNVSSSVHHLRSPRPKSGAFKGPSVSNETVFSLEHPSVETTKLTRSDSLRDRAPQIELNPSSKRHVKRLLHQLLQDAGVPNVAAWEKALVPILIQCTDDVTPDVRNGDYMDIRHYVKFKKIPGGRPGDTSYVSGVIFTKNLALKSMPRRIIRPRIVIVSFPIEYQRHQQHFMSLQPVIEQEKEFLRVVVSRIVKLNPQVLLAERGVSGMALEMLSAANIAVAYNVKPSVIEAVARCAEADIISSLDMLALPVRVGYCDGFEVKTYVNNSYQGKKKSYIFLSGCAPSLGCTIALRGAPTQALSNVKRITEFMVYVVYNLKLETCLMRDEFIHIPKEESELPTPLSTRQGTDDSLKTSSHMGLGLFEDSGPGPTVVINAAESEPPSQLTIDSWEGANETSSPTDDNLNSQDGAGKRLSMHQQHTSDGPDDQAVPEDIPMPTYYSDMVARYETKILSASPFVKFTLPYLLMRARAQERRLVYLKRLRDQDVPQEPVDGKSRSQPFHLIKPDMVHALGQTAPGRLMEVIHAVHDAEYDKALHTYQTHTRQWENYIQGNINLFDPYSHQNIVVLHSVICTESKIPCVEPGLIAIGFYDEQHLDTGMDADCTLGQYIEDLCCSKDTVCASNGCDRAMVQHHRTYVHDQARITMFLEDRPQPSPAPPSDDITMWSYCKVCRKDSPAMPMCESTWKYSFGKYLELLFWSKGLRLNDKADCPHDHHTDHIRYFTFHDARVRIHYDPVELLEIIVPRPRITWKVEHDLNLKNEIYTKTEERWNRYMVSVQARLKNIRIDVVLPEKADACKAEVDRLMKKAQDDHAALIRQMQQTYLDSKYYEVIPFNTVIRQMLEVAGDWDTAFAQFETDFLPDKDVRQLTVLQLKKMFTDTESKESLASADSVTTVESDERPSQAFTESDEKSTQPTDYSTPGLADSTTSTRKDGTHTPLEDPKGMEVTDAAMERVEPLDLATRPVTAVTGQPSGTPPREMLASPKKQAAESSTPTIHPASLSGDVPAIAEEAASPESPASPSPPPHAPRAIPIPEQTLQEKVEHLKRRNRTMPLESPSRRSPTPDTLRGETPEKISRKAGLNVSPPMIRSRTQPSVMQLPKPQAGRQAGPSTTEEGASKPKLSERLAGALKPRKQQASAIPRLVHKKESKVSTLAKHFEQLSREFENQRIRDRKKRAEKMRQRQPRTLLPRTSTAAIVDVYEDVNEAVQEHGASEAEPKRSQESGETRDSSERTQAHPGKAVPEQGEKVKPAGNEAERLSDCDNTTTPGGGAEADDEGEAEPKTSRDSHNASDDEGTSDAEPSLEDLLPEVKAIADSIEPTTEELPRHQKTSLLKMLTNFWAERSSSGWQPLDYPVSLTDHIFMDSDIVVREDEPSSLIAFALDSEDYQAKLADIRHQWHLQIQRSGEEDGGEPRSLPTSVSGGQSVDEELEKSLLRATGTHLRYQFTEGSARMTCKIFYAEQFDALRRKCGVADRIVESLSRCLKWDSRGGKTRAVFLKTLDDRFVLKALSSVETAAFLRFAPSYFGIMAEALFHDLPSVIAKMVGFFQIFIKNPVSNTDVRLDLLMMENLFYDRSPGKIFDLKGSMRNRKIQSTGEQNEVLLDENMVEYIYESPLFAREHSKKLLRASVWNDTLFLARQNVMDYSLMIAIDEDKRELVVGIIDCIRTYTLDKKLESWIKDRGLAGGGRNRPTITSPKEYKSRFREAMARYILQAPNCWHQFGGPTSSIRPRFEELNAE